jgi:hypothetical protein
MPPSFAYYAEASVALRASAAKSEVDFSGARGSADGGELARLAR